jgi:hypothetical protein
MGKNIFLGNIFLNIFINLFIYLLFLIHLRIYLFFIHFLSRIYTEYIPKFAVNTVRHDAMKIQHQLQFLDLRGRPRKFQAMIMMKNLVLIVMNMILVKTYVLTISLCIMLTIITHLIVFKSYFYSVLKLILSIHKHSVNNRNRIRIY